MKCLSSNSIESNIYYKFVWAVMADIVATTSQVGTANPIPWRDNTILQWIATIWCFYSGTFPHQQRWTSATKHTYFKTSTNFRNMFKYSFYLFTLNNINISDAIDLLEALSVQFDTFRLLVSFVYFWSIKHINLIGDHPMNISTKIDSNWPSGFREEDKNVKAYGRRRGRERKVMTTPHMTLWWAKIAVNCFLTIIYDPINDEYPQQCVVRHNLSSVRSRARHLTVNDRQDMFVLKSILIKCQFNIIFINI